MQKSKMYKYESRRVSDGASGIIIPGVFIDICRLEKRMLASVLIAITSALPRSAFENPSANRTDDPAVTVCSNG